MRIWQPCCDVLGLKFETGQIFHVKFVDVVVVWPGSYNNVAPRHVH